MVGTQLPQWLARFNRYFTNPIQRMWAGRVTGMGIIEHVGRRSGKQYRVGNRADVRPEPRLAEELDAVGGRALRGGETFRVREPRIVATAERWSR